jgi:PST family polysaccharide transporter
LFADDIIMVFLGPKWGNAVFIFRLLAPTILAYALIHPFGWLLMSRGMVGRSLKMALIIAPLVILSYIVGLKYGAVGVAIGYSTIMTLLIVPMIVWARHGTPISSNDILKAVSKPLFSGIVGGAFAFGVKYYFVYSTYPIIRLLICSSILLFSYLFILLYGMGQKKIYFDLLQELKVRPSTIEK